MSSLLTLDERLTSLERRVDRLDHRRASPPGGTTPFDWGFSRGKDWRHGRKFMNPYEDGSIRHKDWLAGFLSGLAAGPYRDTSGSLLSSALRE